MDMLQIFGTVVVGTSIVISTGALFTFHIRRLADSEYLVRTGKMCINDQAKLLIPTTAGLWLIAMIIPAIIFGFVRGQTIAEEKNWQQRLDIPTKAAYCVPLGCEVCGELAH